MSSYIVQSSLFGSALLSRSFASLAEADAHFDSEVERLLNPYPGIVFALSRDERCNELGRCRVAHIVCRRKDGKLGRAIKASVQMFEGE